MPKSPDASAQSFHRAPTVACPMRNGLLMVALHEDVADLANVAWLDERAASILRRLADEFGIDDVETLLVATDGAPAEQAAQDALALVGGLAAHGLVEGTVPATDERRAPGKPRESGDVQLAAKELISMARAVLEAGHRLRFVARGLSMLPQIPSGSTLDVSPHSLAQVRRGDVVLYVVEGRLVAHRVVARDANTLTTSGDSAARRDVVDVDNYLGTVTSRIAAGERLDLSENHRRALGLASGFMHRVRRTLARIFLVRPLRVGWIRRSARACLGALSHGLRKIETVGFRLRRRTDVARSALYQTDEKDQVRRDLYASKSVRDFTALDENVEAGLTLIEEVLLTRHPMPNSCGVLVLGCGPGRESVALAQRGYRVTGLDMDRGMLERARALAARHDVDVRWIEGDADTFDVGETFDRIVVFSGLYNMLLPKQRRVSMLEAARKHLSNEGRILLTFLSDYVVPGQGPRPQQVSTATRVNPDHENGDLFLLNEAVHVFPHPDHLAAEARAAGFEVETMFRDQRAYDRAHRQVRGYVILAPRR